ncbi:MAG: putative metal-binding motif-containing protein [Actinomycetota bacterium]
MWWRTIVLLVGTSWVAWLWACEPECTSSESPRTCGTDEGLCQAGTQVCVGGNWGPCIGEVLPSLEVCGDGEDNDCDGTVDEISPESCDGIDNDCDGTTDEDSFAATETAAQETLSGVVHFIERLPKSSGDGDVFLAGAFDDGGPSFSVALYDGSGDIIDTATSGQPRVLQAGVTGEIRAAVSPDGARAVVTRVDSANRVVHAAVLDLDDDLNPPTDTVAGPSICLGLDEIVLSSASGARPQSVIPVYDNDNPGEVVFFVYWNDLTIRAVRHTVPTNCTTGTWGTPISDTLVVSGVSLDYAVIAPDDANEPFLLAYYAATLMVARLDRVAPVVDVADEISISGSTSAVELAPGPGATVAIAYNETVQPGMRRVMLHQFSAATLTCIDPPGGTLDNCVVDVAATQSGVPSLTYRNDGTWLVGHIATTDGWGVTIVDTDDVVVGNAVEIDPLNPTNPSPTPTHIAASEIGSVLVSKSSDLNGSLVRPLYTFFACEDCFYFNDIDGDGYGTGTPMSICSAPAGWAALDGDCDETNAEVNPGSGFRTVPRPNGSWDWDCGNGVIKQYTDFYPTCETGPGEGFEGWHSWTDSPACGVTEDWISSTESGCSYGQRTQGCK